jgi:GNAT superfamily N-acetyltransferase
MAPRTAARRAKYNENPQMLIRRALPNEAQSLTDLALRSKRAWGYDDDFMERVLPDMVVHEEYLIVEHGLVAEDAGKVIGYAILRVDGVTAHLRDLFVEPDRFGEGVGRALFQEAARLAREYGAESLRLEGDPNAIGFYERMGLRQVGAQPSIVGNGRMLPLMEIDLS